MKPTRLPKKKKKKSIKTQPMARRVHPAHSALAQMKLLRILRCGARSLLSGAPPCTQRCMHMWATPHLPTGMPYWMRNNLQHSWTTIGGVTKQQEWITLRGIACQTYCGNGRPAFKPPTAHTPPAQPVRGPMAAPATASAPSFLLFYYDVR
jgi:hypothetical protein